MYHLLEMTVLGLSKYLYHIKKLVVYLNLEGKPKEANPNLIQFGISRKQKCKTTTNNNNLRKQRSLRLGN